jgi:hypothetical protein
MSAPNQPDPRLTRTSQTSEQAREQIASAHKLLIELQRQLGHHPELGEAITKLEMALNTLAVQTGGLL